MVKVKNQVSAAKRSEAALTYKKNSGILHRKLITLTKNPKGELHNEINT